MYCFSQRFFKRQASVFFFFSWMIVDVVADRKSINPESLSLNLKTKSEDSNQTIVFYRKSSGSAFDFHKSLNFMIEQFEVREEMLITPNKYPKILLKIDSATAPGLHISIDLLDGLLELLKSRGYAKERVELLFFEVDEVKRSEGFNAITENGFYKGYRVRSPNDYDFYESNWFHDSPMPPKVHDRAKFYLRFPNDRKKRLEEERKSYLPSALLNPDVYWISMSNIMDDMNLGILGASSNMSLGMVSNSRRFREDPTLGAAAVTEILAIPEIWERRIFSILDLSRFQFAGGVDFNAEFVDSSPSLLLSRNPFAVDSVAWNFLSRIRASQNLKARKKENALMFKYAQSLGLGKVDNPIIFSVSSK